MHAETQDEKFARFDQMMERIPGSTSWLHNGEILVEQGVEFEFVCYDAKVEVVAELDFLWAYAYVLMVIGTHNNTQDKK